MKKKEWGNAVWLLFHTLAEKIKPEHTSELNILVSHISSICNNLPCPDCQQHATRVMAQANKAYLISSKENLITFLWNFHNDVNKRTNNAFYPQESLNKYKSANTINVIKNFMHIMSAVTNNEKTMLFGFHRALYMKEFTNYIRGSIGKYNP
jgi:hypothetical protein